MRGAEQSRGGSQEKVWAYLVITARSHRQLSCLNFTRAISPRDEGVGLLYHLLASHCLQAAPVQQGWNLAPQSSHFSGKAALVLPRPFLRRRGHLGAVSSSQGMGEPAQERGSWWSSISIHYSDLGICHPDTSTLLLGKTVQVQSQHGCC